MKKKPKQKNKGGRPSDYRTDYAEQARKLCVLGATDAQLADFFGISESTLNLWKLRHAKFSESIKTGKLVADAEVADALYNRALGYSHKAVKIMQHEGIPIEHEYTEHYPPDATSAIFWLKNRQPTKWRNDQTVSDEVNKATINLPTELIEAANAARKKRLENGQK
jgi:hypothetical protein